MFSRITLGAGWIQIPETIDGKPDPGNEMIEGES